MPKGYDAIMAEMEAERKKAEEASPEDELYQWNPTKVDSRAELATSALAACAEPGEDGTKAAEKLRATLAEIDARRGR